MSLAKVHWTRRVALVLALTVGMLSGGQGRFAAAAPQIIETTITKDRLAGADFGALPPGVDTVKLILNGPYDPKTNPKGYTGSVIYPPEGSIWKKTVDAQGRHVYQIAVTSQTDSTLLASTTTCTGSGSGPCDETKTCTITTDGANGCGGSTSLSAQSVPTRTKAERLSKSEPGGGVRMPQMLSGSSFPDARNISRVPHRTIHVNVTPQKAKTKAKSTTDTIGYLRFTITGKGVALYRKAGKKQITEDTQISVGPKGLDEDFYFVTNGDFKESVTIQSHFTYADSEKAETYYTPPNCEDKFGTVPCCIPTVTHIPPDPQCCSCDPNDCKGVTMYGSIMLPNFIGTGGDLGYNNSIYNNPTNTNLYDSGNPCGQSSSSASAARAATGDTINGIVPTGINFGNGMNQLVREWPFISFATGEKAYTMLVVFGGQEMFWFDGSSNSNNYTARYGAKQTLTYNESGHFFILTKQDGTVYKFNDLDDDQTNPPGLFYESVSPGGKITRVTQYVNTHGDQAPDRIGEIQRGTIVNEQFVATEKLVYNFVHPQQGTVDYLQDVTTSRSTDGTTWTPVRKVAFTYTSSGDQETISELVPDGQNGWATVGTRYYRYWDNHLVKYFFEPQAYANLVAAVSNPSQAEDSAVAPFASHYFEYDDSRRVTRHDQFGGTKSIAFNYSTWALPAGPTITGTYSYEDATNVNANAPNQWMTKIVETWDDNSQAQMTEVTRTTYVNQLGQPIVKDLVCGDSRWIEYYKYDDNYRLILQAEPSAIAGCDMATSSTDYVTRARIGLDKDEHSIPGDDWQSVPESIRTQCEAELEDYVNKWPPQFYPTRYPHYVSVEHIHHQRSAASSASYKLDGNNEEKVGLVHTYSYYDTGDVAPGYLRYENARHGNAGSDIPIHENVYTSHTAHGSTAYPPSVSRVFLGEDGTGSITTSYAYTYHTGTNAIAERVTTLPAISTDHNGSGIANIRKEYLDIDGNVVWLKDERGSFTYNSYDSLTGAIIQTIQDVKSGQGLTPPTGWGDLPASGLHVVTDYTHDIRGRITQTLGPAHNVDGVQVRTAMWTVYDDANHTTRTAQGYQVVGTGAYTLVNPVSITKTDLDGRVLEQIQAVRGSGVTSSGALSASDTFAQSSYTRWTVNMYSNTMLTSSRVYHLIPSSGEGTASTNYAETSYAYDSLGRLVKTVAPNGTIYRNGLDVRSRVVWTKVGTTENNLVLLTENQYDGGGCSCGANGNVTQITQHIDASTTRISQFTYDWRDRRLTSSASDGTTTYITYNTYDNLNHITQVDRYHTAAQDANLVARNKTYYDELGRVYKTERIPVTDSTPGTALATNSWYDASGNRITMTDPLSRQSTWEYDSLNRVAKETLPDPDGENNPGLAPWTVYAYDAASNLLSTTDRLDHTTTFGYDAIGRKISSTDPDNGVTLSTFSAAGNMATLTDPVNNTTSWGYDALGRIVQETNALSALRTFTYDVSGNLVSKTDRRGLVTEYSYDYLNHRTSELWKDGQSTIRTFTFTYDRLGDLLTASDPAASYTYTYDGVSRAASIVASITGLTPTVTLAQSYNTLGRRFQLAATIGTTADFVDSYSYDGLGRMSSVAQSGATGGNAVAEKRIDFAYDSGDQLSSITRYNNLTGTQTVAASSYTFDLTGRLTALTHAKGGTTLADYDWTFDATNRMTGQVSALDGTAAYTNDAAGQLTGASYAYQPSLDAEAYVYDANGNRTNNNYTIGTNNRLTSDGIYTYTYDAEGNRTVRINNSTGATTRYTWDHRNRLVLVAEYADANLQTQSNKTTEYTYDYLNRWLTRVVDSDGDTGTADVEKTTYVHDAAQIVLHFTRTGSGDIVTSDLKHRYAWGPNVDQLLTDETVSSLNTAGSVLWPLGDHMDTIRDLVTYDNGTDMTTISNHRVYNVFGRVTSETNSAITCLFSFTARPVDISTGLQNNLYRWYDCLVGRWLNEDPISFEGGDANLYRYVGNNPLHSIDPSGLAGYISDAAIAAARQQLRKAGLSEGEINVRMKILKSLADTSGHIMYDNGSCQDWANETILDAYGVDPGDSDYSKKTDKYTRTTKCHSKDGLDVSKSLPGDQIHFNNPYHRTDPHVKDDPLENGCNTFVVGKDSRGILLYNRWARWNGTGFVDSTTGIMTVEQYRNWMGTWDSVKGRYTTPKPNLPIDRVRCPLSPK